MEVHNDQLEEETTGLEKLSGDFRLFCFYFNKSIETNLPIQKNIQENVLPTQSLLTNTAIRQTLKELLKRRRKWLRSTRMILFICEDPVLTTFSKTN